MNLDIRKIVWRRNKIIFFLPFVFPTIFFIYLVLVTMRKKSAPGAHKSNDLKKSCEPNKLNSSNQEDHKSCLKYSSNNVFAILLCVCKQSRNLCRFLAFWKIFWKIFLYMYIVVSHVYNVHKSLMNSNRINFVYQ